MVSVRSRLTPVGDVLAGVMKDRGLEAGLRLSGLQGIWEGAVGPGVASHAAPENLKGGLLTITVDSSVWMNQLSLLRLDIMEKLNLAAGTETVTDLRFRMGQVSGQKTKKQEPPFTPKRRSLGPEEKAEVEEAVGAIPDPELRARARRLLISAKARVR